MKILFAGNSITICPPVPDIGWFGDWGMAASTEENDYVHYTVKKLNEIAGPVEHMSFNAADFEREFECFDFDRYKMRRDFDADIIVVRLIENVDPKKLDELDFAGALRDFIGYLNKNGNAKVFCTGAFCPNPKGDIVVRKACSDYGYTYIDISSLQGDIKNTARSEFKDAGVGAHPSDLGMAGIGCLILESIKSHIV